MSDRTNALWTIDELIAATGGTLHGQAAAVSGIAIDSREAQAGDLFVALPSESGGRDGHEFIGNAHQNGAALALVSHLAESAGPQLLVPDTPQALRDLAIAARTRCNAKRAAVTGSVGKTGTTRAIAAGLSAAGATHAPVGSFNNHVGVPLTLARMPRGTQRAVFELGMNHAGEITPLSQMVQPHVALITTVGAVHAEHFPDGEAGIARAKAEIFAGMQPGSIAVLNRDNPWFDLLSAEARAKNLTIQSFGAHADADLRLTGSKILEDGLCVDATRGGNTFCFTLRQHGQHWALNSLGVLLVLDAMDVPHENALAALADFAPQAGRGETHRIEILGGAFRLIDESYNANPVSMKATLDYLGQQTGGRKIAVLTDMLELGDNAPRWHAELADVIAASGIELVFCAGPLMQNLWDALPATRRGAYAAIASELAAQLLGAIRPGDIVLVKGSKGSKAASLAAALLTLKDKAA